MRRQATTVDFHVSAGDVIFHERFEGHLDRFSAGETILLNLNLCTGSAQRRVNRSLSGTARDLKFL
jgi:hypothetical protein